MIIIITTVIAAYFDYKAYKHFDMPAGSVLWPAVLAALIFTITKHISTCHP